MTYTQDPPPEGSERFWTHWAEVQKYNNHWEVTLRVDWKWSQIVFRKEYDTQAEAERIAREWVGLAREEMRDE
jgi:hypothetical protein